MAVVQRPRRPGASSSPAADTEFDFGGIGITEYHRPSGRAPELPDDLTALDDVDLVRLLTHLTRWHDYAARLLSEAEVENRRRDIELAETRAIAMVQNWGGGRDEKVRRAEAARDASPEMHESNQAALEAYALRKRLEARTQSFADDAFVVSRELTRRTHMEPPVRRESRWGGS